MGAHKGPLNHKELKYGTDFFPSLLFQLYFKENLPHLLVPLNTHSEQSRLFAVVG